MKLVINFSHHPYTKIQQHDKDKLSASTVNFHAFEKEEQKKQHYYPNITVVNL